MARGFHRLAHGLHALAVTETARHASCLGPAAVAIHDDGDMPGKPPACPALSIAPSKFERPQRLRTRLKPA